MNAKQLSSHLALSPPQSLLHFFTCGGTESLSTRLLNSALIRGKISELSVINNTARIRGNVKRYFIFLSLSLGGCRLHNFFPLLLTMPGYIITVEPITQFTLLISRINGRYLLPLNVHTRADLHLKMVHSDKEPLLFRRACN